MKKRATCFILLFIFSISVALASEDSNTSIDYITGYWQGCVDALTLMFNSSEDMEDATSSLSQIEQLLTPSEPTPAFLSLEDHLAIVSDICSDKRITVTEFQEFKKDMPFPQFAYIATLENPIAAAIAIRIRNACSEVYDFVDGLTKADATITEETEELFEDHIIILIALRDSLISIAGSDAISTINLSSQKLEETAQAIKIEADPEAVNSMQDTVHQVMDTVKRNSK